ncbi:MAG: LuxR C-terminal-related transcriptional regulator [Sporichthyaceae bacterium]
MQEWPLVGRAHVLHALRDAVLTPNSRGVVLAGAAGVGKSRLAAEVLALAERADMATARVSATKSAAGIPLGALAPVLPVARAAPGAVDDRADLLRRCAGALLETSGGRRLVLLVDDAHCLDDTSATLIHQLAQTEQALVVATVRSGEPAPDPIVALWKDALCERIEIAGLPASAIAEVLAFVLGGSVDEATLADLTARSHGNMMFLRELVRGAQEDGVLRKDGGVWRLAGDLRPNDRLVELVEARLAGLAPSERSVLEIVSFAEPVGPGELARLSSLEIAERLERLGLLTSATTGRRIAITLAHPLYGEVLRARVPGLRARTIARDLAQTVEAFGARRREDTLRVATWRLVGGGAQPELMLTAAITARWRYDFPLAERLARAAVAAGAGFDAEVLAAQLTALQGQSGAAADELTALAVRANDDDARGRVALSRLDNRVIYAGTIDEGLRIATQAEEALAGTAWADEIASRKVALLLAKEGPRSAAALALPLLERARGEALVWACMPGSYSLARTGAISAAIEAARRGREAHASLTEAMDWYPWMHCFYEGEALAHAGQFTAAHELATARYRDGVRESAVEAQALFSWQLAKTVADRGHVEQALHRAQVAIALYRQLDRPQFVEFSLIYLALALAIGRRPAEATEAMARHDALAQVEPSYFMGADVMHARGWVAVAGGDIGAGADLLRAAAQTCVQIGDLVGAAAAMHSMARIGYAKEIHLQLSEIAARIEGELGVARAAHARALVEADGSALIAVSNTFCELGADLLAAESQADAGVVWRRRGDHRSAAAAEQRASWLAARCVGAQTPALRGGAARARLTPAEWEAAQLAAAGRSNKAIARELVVSVRTIENRLQHVYGKLGITSRVELAAAIEMLDESARG